MEALRSKPAEVRFPLLSVSHDADSPSCNQTPLSQVPAASAANILSAASSFSTFLSTLDPVSSPRLSLLPPHLAALVHSEALKRVSRAYGELYDAVLEEKNGFEGKESLLRRSKGEVAMLLDVQ
jgi:hypothetical protein